MAAHATAPAPHRPGYPATWPPAAARWLFGRDTRPLRSALLPHRHLREREPPYARAPHGESTHSDAPVRPQSRVPLPGKGPTDAHAQIDSTPARYSQVTHSKSNTPEPLPAKMFPTSSTRTGVSTPAQCATLAGVPHGWTKWSAHCRRARAEKPA